MQATRVLTVYGRSYCSLCKDMLTALETLRPRYGFRLDWVDIEDQEALEACYGDKVPVLMAGEVELCHYHLDRAKLDALFPQMR